MRSQLQYASVIFDLLNTLARWKYRLGVRKVCSFLRRHGYEVYEQEYDATFRYVMFVYFPKHGLKDYRDMLIHIFSYLDLRVDELVLNRLSRLYSRYNRMEIYSDVIPALKQMKSEGLKTAIATTTP